MKTSHRRANAIRPLLGALLSLAVLSGCGHRPTGYQAVEDRVTTRGGGFVVPIENGVFHDVLYNPESVSLSFPGYIVGLDKGRHRHVGQGAEYPADAVSDDDGLRRVKRRMQEDPKMQYVSHVVRNEGKPFGQGNCVLYTMYQSWGDASAGEQAGEAPVAPCNAAFPLVGDPSSAQVESWKALDALRLEIRRAVAAKPDGYTHVMLAVMGWNTPQIEAVRNFNAIAAGIKLAAGSARFEPLFVGVTWPSVWTAEWLDPAIKIVSYRAKANDADEVGTIWISQVADILREEAPADAQLVAIGHSFGARAVFSAICSNNVWDKKSSATRKWGTLIGWQPAFSIKRFVKGGSNDGFRYTRACLDRAETIVLTASKHDAAVDNAIWADMTGSHAAWASVCDPVAVDRKLVSDPVCVRADQITSASASEAEIVRSRINYLDASTIVFFNQPNTGGGAHSDIYRAVHGRLNWNVMNPTGSQPHLVQTHVHR